MSARQASALEWAAALALARNPAERAVLCALARYANRTNGVVQEPRTVLAAAATMSVASFRTHAAALSGRERGLVAATTLRAVHGDYDTTIYTLIGWLHLRGMSEPEHLRLASGASETATSGVERGEETQGEPGGSANLAHGGLPKSSRPGVVEFSRPSDEIYQTPAKFQQTPSKESALLERVEDINSLPLPLTFPRARGTSGGLRGDAGEIVALVNHPKLDPVKAPDLATSTTWIASWRSRLGVPISVEEIAMVICVALEKRDRRNRGADQITTWKFFNGAVRDFAAQKLAAALEQPPGDTHAPRFDNVRPLNAAEREQALAAERRASWNRVAQRREGA